MDEQKKNQTQQQQQQQPPQDANYAPYNTEPTFLDQSGEQAYSNLREAQNPKVDTSAIEGTPLVNREPADTTVARRAGTMWANAADLNKQAAAQPAPAPVAWEPKKEVEPYSEVERLLRANLDALRATERTPEELAKIRRRQAAQRMVASMGTAAANIANMIGTANYAPSMTVANLGEEAKKRHDEWRKQYDDDRERQLRMALQLISMREAKADRERQNKLAEYTQAKAERDDDWQEEVREQTRKEWPLKIQELLAKIPETEANTERNLSIARKNDRYVQKTGSGSGGGKGRKEYKIDGVDYGNAEMYKKAAHEMAKDMGIPIMRDVITDGPNGRTKTTGYRRPEDIASDIEIELERRRKSGSSSSSKGATGKGAASQGKTASSNTAGKSQSKSGKYGKGSQDAARQLGWIK